MTLILRNWITSASPVWVLKTLSVTQKCALYMKHIDGISGQAITRLAVNLGHSPYTYALHRWYIHTISIEIYLHGLSQKCLFSHFRGPNCEQHFSKLIIFAPIFTHYCLHIPTQTYWQVSIFTLSRTQLWTTLVKIDHSCSHFLHITAFIYY